MPRSIVLEATKRKREELNGNEIRRAGVWWCHKPAEECQMARICAEKYQEQGEN